MVNVNKPVAGSTRARTVARDHQKLGAAAADCAREGRDKVQQVKRSFAQYVQEQPLKSILIAAGIGWVFGRFWIRR